MHFVQREMKREICFDVHVLYHLNKIVLYLIVLEFDNVIVINLSMKLLNIIFSHVFSARALSEAAISIYFRELEQEFETKFF